MHTKSIFAFATLALAAGTVFADSANDAPLTRAQVVQSVLAARAAGTLIPAGEGPDESQQSAYDGSSSARSNVSRAQINADVLHARADGTLRPAGDAADENPVIEAQASNFRSNLTRAQVKADVIEARAQGELVPAGEAEEPVGNATHKTFTALAPTRNRTN